MAKPEIVTFHSRYTEHELVRRPKDAEPTRAGGYRITQQRIAYQFHAAPSPDKAMLIGVCQVRVGQDKMVEPNPMGWLAPDEDQDLERDAPTALMAHNAFGRDFWLAGHEIGTLYPRPQDFRRDLMAAIANFDLEGIEGMVEKERATHARPDLIGDGEAAAENVRDALASVPAPPEPEPKAAKAKTPAAA